MKAWEIITRLLFPSDFFSLHKCIQSTCRIAKRNPAVTYSGTEKVRHFAMTLLCFWISSPGFPSTEPSTSLPFYWTGWVQTGREKNKNKIKNKIKKKKHRIIVFMILWHQNTWVQECVFRQELCSEGTEKVGSRSLLTVPLLSWVLPCILGQLWPTAVKLLLEKFSWKSVKVLSSFLPLSREFISVCLYSWGGPCNYFVP